MRGSLSWLTAQEGKRPGLRNEVVISLSRVPAPLLVVDAPSLLYRAFFALPQSITDGDGQPVNALLGMANLVLFVVERRAPRAVVLCWGAEAAVYRTDLYAPYHADRPPMPPELERQSSSAASAGAASPTRSSRPTTSWARSRGSSRRPAARC
jgi:hypothetical protein